MKSRLLTRFILCSLLFALSGPLFGTENVVEKETVAIQLESWALTLYYKINCPYSQKVIRYLNMSGIAIHLKDIQRNPATRAELMGLTGKARVPCLWINNAPLYDSDLIIQWLEENIEQPL